MKIAIFGFGNMGRTFANAFINSRFIRIEDILLYSRSPLIEGDTLGIPLSQVFRSPNDRIKNSDILIISVKPQDFDQLALHLKPYIQPHHVILSVMAGVSIDKIKQALGNTNIVRSMPNLPSQVGLGMTVLSASEEIDRKDLFIVQNLINTTGKSVYVENEFLIHAATAVSGSGPAYVFYFMHSMIDAAIEIGFDEAQAELLVKQTFLGAIQLYNHQALSTSDWIRKVSSKGGTTEKAILHFEKELVHQKIIQTIEAARNRSIELGL